MWMYGLAAFTSLLEEMQRMSNAPCSEYFTISIFFHLHSSFFLKAKGGWVERVNDFNKFLANF